MVLVLVVGEITKERGHGGDDTEKSEYKHPLSSWPRAPLTQAHPSFFFSFDLVASLLTLLYYTLLYFTSPTKPSFLLFLPATTTPSSPSSTPQPLNPSPTRRSHPLQSTATMSVLFYRRPDYLNKSVGPITSSECARYVERAKSEYLFPRTSGRPRSVLTS